MNNLYYSTYQNGIYDPIYLPPIIFYDEEHESSIAQTPHAEA
jgi:hypothetical protein